MTQKTPLKRLCVKSHKSVTSIGHATQSDSSLVIFPSTQIRLHVYGVNSVTMFTATCVYCCNWTEI